MVRINHDLISELCRRHDVRVLKLFGSAVRGEDRPDSDIDLIVEFTGEKSLFDLMRLEADLEQALGREVDLVTEPSISPYLRERILSSASVVYERAG
jgi:uncharacterized protein